MRVSYRNAVAAIGLLSLGACADGLDFGPIFGGSGSSAAQSGASGSAAATMLTVADQSFMAQAAYGGLGEVALGRVAQAQGSSAAVREFGQRMVNEHSRANDELAALARAKGMTPPTAPDPGRQATMESLQSLRGANFDQQYVQQQLTEHELAVALYDAQARRGSDRDVQAFATKWLPTLREHTQQLRSMNATMAGVINR